MRRCQQCRQRRELALLRAPLAHPQLLLRLLILSNKKKYASFNNL